MRRVWFVFFVVLLASPAIAQVQTPETNIIQRLFVLIGSHPDVKLRSDMQQWYKQGKYRIIVDLGIPNFGWSNYHEPGKPEKIWPTLRVNPEIFITTYVTEAQQRQNPQAIPAEKYGMLYHEYVHLVNHFNGKYPFDKLTNKEPLPLQARYYWDNELDAFLGQYQFLKRYRYAYIFIKPEFERLGEWESFVRTVYDNLQVYPRFREFKPFWDKFLEETLRLPRLAENKAFDEPVAAGKSFRLPLAFFCQDKGLT